MAVTWLDLTPASGTSSLPQRNGRSTLFSGRVEPSWRRLGNPRHHGVTARMASFAAFSSGIALRLGSRRLRGHCQRMALSGKEVVAVRTGLPDIAALQVLLETVFDAENDGSDPQKLWLSWVRSMSSSGLVPVEVLVWLPAVHDFFRSRGLLAKSVPERCAWVLQAARCSAKLSLGLRPGAVRLGEAEVGVGSAQRRQKQLVPPNLAGSVLLGRVVRISSLGVLVEIDEPCLGLIHASRLARPLASFAPGDKLQVLVLGADTTAQAISLRELTEGEQLRCKGSNWQQKQRSEKFLLPNVGDEVKCVAKESPSEANGFTLQVEVLDRQGLLGEVPREELPTGGASEGSQLLRLHVLDLVLGTKQAIQPLLSDRGLRRSLSDISRGARVPARVVEVLSGESGLLVDFGCTALGEVPSSNLLRNKNSYEIGELLKDLVITGDRQALLAEGKAMLQERQPPPWRREAFQRKTLSDRIKVGAVLVGRVRALKKGLLVVDVAESNTALIPPKLLQRPLAEYTIGEAVLLRVLSYNRGNLRLYLREVFQNEECASYPGTSDALTQPLLSGADNSNNSNNNNKARLTEAVEMPAKSTDEVSRTTSVSSAMETALAALASLTTANTIVTNANSEAGATATETAGSKPRTEPIPADKNYNNNNNNNDLSAFLLSAERGPEMLQRPTS
ncbi:unnamed protein product, partial [Polarella glacialis]